MEQPERDSEIFDRIPWDSLDQGRDRRWQAWIAAGLMVLVGIGVSVGRTVMQPPPPAETPALVSTTIPPVASQPVTSIVATTLAAADTQPLSEADLMAAGVPAMEWEAAVRAEHFVVDFFTKDSSEERSFVEWAEALPPVWTDANTVVVDVLVRRLAALGEGPYARVPDERWSVSMAVSGSDWQITTGPVVSAGEAATSTEPGGARETWVDAAGLEWELWSAPQP